jgi:hypothetical protein
MWLDDMLLFCFQVNKLTNLLEGDYIKCCFKNRKTVDVRLLCSPGKVPFIDLFLAHLSHSDGVGFCDRILSVVRPSIRSHEPILMWLGNNT